MQARGLKHIVYMGVHENMCIIARPFAIHEMTKLGFTAENIAVVRELVDVMYTPMDAPYVSHAEGLRLQTSYIEKASLHQYAPDLQSCALDLCDKI